MFLFFRLLDPQSERIVREMQSLMEKVEEMRSQRAMLTSQLRDSICKDDITQLLVTQPNENVDTLFQEELKKHQDIVSNPKCILIFIFYYLVN